MIDGHSHMLMDRDRAGTKRKSVQDLKEVDPDDLFEKMDEIRSLADGHHSPRNGARGRGVVGHE